MIEVTSEPRCPAWCRNGELHLGDQLRRGASYLHLGHPVSFVTVDEEDRERDRLPVWLMQTHRVDERGWHADPPYVGVGTYGIGVAEARRLADALHEMADLAEAG